VVLTGGGMNTYSTVAPSASISALACCTRAKTPAVVVCTWVVLEVAPGPGLGCGMPT
jgi:hypothetical protein